MKIVTLRDTDAYDLVQRLRADGAVQLAQIIQRQLSDPLLNSDHERHLLVSVGADGFGLIVKMVSAEAADKAWRDLAGRAAGGGGAGVELPDHVDGARKRQRRIRRSAQRPRRKR